MIRARVKSSTSCNRLSHAEHGTKEEFPCNFNKINSNNINNVFSNGIYFSENSSLSQNASTKMNKKSAHPLNVSSSQLNILDLNSNKKLITTSFSSSSLKFQKTNLKLNTVLPENITNQQSRLNKENKFLTKCIISVDTSKARSNAEVLKMCLTELGWQDCPNGLAGGCDIIWQSSTSSHEGEHGNSIPNTNKDQQSRINKFPCN